VSSSAVCAPPHDDRSWRLTIGAPRRVKSEPIIEIEYENKNVERMVTTDMTITQILERVESKAQEMEMAAKLKQAGLEGQRLETPWMQHMGKETAVGSTAHVPRQQ
jgi:hypothetical protein